MQLTFGSEQSPSEKSVVLKTSQDEYIMGFFWNREGEYLIPYGFRNKYRYQQQVLGTFKHSEDSYILTGFFTACRYAVNWEEEPLTPFSKCFLLPSADTKEARIVLCVILASSVLCT